MKDWVEHFREAAKGMAVSHIWRGHGSALFIEFGELTSGTRKRGDGSPGPLEGQIGLMIEWSWRIEDERSIVCGSWSDDELWKPTRPSPASLASTSSIWPSSVACQKC